MTLGRVGADVLHVDGRTDGRTLQSTQYDQQMHVCAMSLQPLTV